MFQLQYIWILSKGMQKAKEEQRNKEMLQMQQSRILGKRLQVRAKDLDKEDDNKKESFVKGSE